MTEMPFANENNDKFDLSFLEDEVREGFYVPAVMKQFWAAELETLKMFDTICRKHGLKYFADWGSLLGAVRHGGFIPWDDDLDVLMIRDDYMKLLKLWDEHPEEFPKEFEVRSFRNREDLIEFHGVIVGANCISFSQERMTKFHGFPYIPAIDIFVLDYKSENMEKQREMAKNALFVIAVADEIGEGKLDSNSIRINLERISKMPNVARTIEVNGKSNIQIRTVLYDVAEKMFASFRDENSGKLIQNIPWGLLDPEREIPLEYYRNVISLPFEYTTIPVPAVFDDLLAQKYGNYLKVVKGVGAHEYPCFTEQERSLMNSVDFEVPHFSISHKTIEKLADERKQARSCSWKSTASECLQEMTEMIVKTENNIQILADLQQLTMNLGEYLEATGRVSEKDIALLEKLCEKIYEAYVNFADVSFKENLLSVFEAVKDNLTNIINREEVVFVPFKQKGWERLADIYKTESNGDKEVIVIDAPYFYKQYDGAIVEKKESKIDYPDDAKVVLFSEYNFELYHPDKIYIQFPYDSWNPVMTIPSELYAESIVKYTDKLIYIPWFETDDFSTEDIPDMVNTKYYIPMPGVVYSDEILLPSQRQKDIYVEVLSSFAPFVSSDYWNDKILIRNCEKLSHNPSGVKKLFYYIGISAFVRDKKKTIEKIKRNYTIFKENSPQIEVYVYEENLIKDYLADTDPDCLNEFSEIMNSWKNEALVNFVEKTGDEDVAKQYDAYYGDTGRFVGYFVREHKPVMIQNEQV